MVKSRVLKGLAEATVHARVHRIVCDWLRDDVSAECKKHLDARVCAKLVDRLCGSTTTFVEIPRRK